MGSEDMSSESTSGGKPHKAVINGYSVSQYYDNYNDEYHVRPGSESPDTFFFVQAPSLPSQSQSQSQSPTPSPAQAYAHIHKQQQQAHNHDHSHQEDRQQFTSDSSHTPPSIPVGKKGGRRVSIARPSQQRSSNAQSNDTKDNVTTITKDTGGNPNTNTKDNMANKQRIQSLSSLPPITLIHLLQTKEEETRRAKKMLKTALMQLEMEVGRGDLLERRVRELETNGERERIDRGREKEKEKLIKAALDEQRVQGKERGEEVEGLKLRLNNTEKELRRIKEDYRALQIERDDSDRALVRARTLAREMKEKAILIQAREQGRQEGFEEGLRRGRVLAGERQNNEESSGGEASGSGNMGRNRRSSTNRRRGGHHRSNTNPTDAIPRASVEAEAAMSAMKAIAERENLRVQLQLKAVERELDMERSRMKDVEREKAQMERMAREERERRAEREREQERQRVREREAREEKEREMREAVKREIEKERWEREKERERLEREKDKMEIEKKDVEKKLSEAEESRIKEKEKFEKQLKKAAATQPVLPYLPMAPPPTPTTTTKSTTRVPQVPRTSSSGSHRRTTQQNRRSSLDSYTSQASTIAFDILQLPTGDRDRDRSGGGGGGGGDLSVIPEDASVRGGVSTPSATNSVSGAVPTAVPVPPAPSWFTNPPIDYTKNNGTASPDLRRQQEPANGGGSHYAPYNRPYPPHQQHVNRADFLAPTNHNNNNNGYSSHRSSGSTYDIIIEPPSRPESATGGGPEPNVHNNNNDNGYLSPHHAPSPLPPTQPSQGHGPGRGGSPTVNPIPIPPRYTGAPHHQQQQQQYQYDTSGIQTQPNSPGVGTIGLNGGVLPPGFIPQSITDARGRSTPIPGGGAGMGFIPPPPGNTRPPSRSGTPSNHNQWHNNNTNPVIPPLQRPHTPSGPASVPIYGNPITLERDKKRDDPGVGVVPTSSTTPPPQSPGGGPWSVPHPPIFPVRGPPAAWGTGTGTGAGAEAWGGTGVGIGNQNQNQNRQFQSSFEYSPVSSHRPVIPGQMGGGGGDGGGTSHGFGAGGMTPGSIRNHELPPSQSGRGGSGWGTPVVPTVGMTPGPRNHDLPPVIPGQSGAGVGWGTPAAPGFATTGMTPGPRNHDLPPVIPGRSGGGGGGGWGGMTPGSRNHHDLPPVIPTQSGGGGSAWGTPAAAGFAGAGMTPGPRHQELSPLSPAIPSQAGFSTYAAPPPVAPPSASGSVGGGLPRASSPYPSASAFHNQDPDEEEEGDDMVKVATVQNTKMNGGGGGGRGGKKGKGKRR